MALKKVTLMLSTTLSLPIISTIVSCNRINSSINDQFDHEKNDQITQLENNGIINKEELNQIKDTFIKIKALLSTQPWDEEDICKSNTKPGPYVCGSDFTTSQSLADINVNKKIREKIVKKIEHLEQHNPNPVNLKNIRFVPELKSELFKASRATHTVKNEVNVQVIYLKDNFQTSITFPLEIKGVYQDLDELIDQTVENLKNPVSFADSFLLEDDDLQYEKIETEFLRLINMQMDQEDERIRVKLIDKNQDLKNNEEINIAIIGKDDTDQITKYTKVKIDGLKTVSQYLQQLRTNIIIQRNHELYANIIGQSYPNSMIGSKLFQLVKDLNTSTSILKERAIESFELDPITDVILHERTNNLTAKVKLEFNKTLADIDLRLLDVEKHPQVVIDEVANYLTQHAPRFDQSQAPIFTDSNFNASNIRNYLLEQVEQFKQQGRIDFNIDPKNDIAIRIVSVNDGNNDSSKIIRLEVSHKTIQAVNTVALIDRFVNVTFINFQKSPYEHLKERIEDDIFSSHDVLINRNEFDRMFVTNASLLEFTDFEINTFLIPAVSQHFDNDPYITVELDSKQRPAMDHSGFRRIKFKFSFTRNGVKAEKTWTLIFKPM